MATCSDVPGRRLDSTERAAAAVCTGRDRFIDALRAFAILVIVGQHWTPPVLSGDDAILTAGDSPAVLAGWPGTWLSPAIPLIFFAGGAAAAISLRTRRRPAADRPTVSWLADRTIRLALPVLPLVAVLLPLHHLIVSAAAQAQPFHSAAGSVGRLLSFFAVYALLVTLSPVLVRLHTRCRGREVIVMTACVVAGDIVRFADSDRASWLGSASTVLALGAIYQAGMAYGHGRFEDVRRRQLTALCLGGLAASVPAFGSYVLHAITMPADQPSSTNPPTVALLALGATQLGLALTLRDALDRWASRRPVAAMLEWICARTTAIYLWHVPALVAGVAITGFHLDAPQPFGTGWHSDALLRLAAFTVVLAGFVGVFGHYERRARRCLARIGSRSGASLNAHPPVYRMGS